MDMIAEREVSTNWGLMLVQGFVLFFTGLFLVTFPGITTEVLVAILGLYWLISGILSITRIFTRSGRAHWGWSLALGALGIFAGIIVLQHPLLSALLVPAVLIIILGIDALIMSVVNFVRGFAGEGGWTFVAGAVDLLIGLALLGSPVIAAGFLPLVLGILGLAGGVILVALSFSMRRMVMEEVTPQHLRRVA